MNANELRLGNYVAVPIQEQTPFRIDAFEHLSDKFTKVAMKQFIGGTEVHPLTWYGDDLQPIPVTKDWVIDFGFVFHNKIFAWVKTWGDYGTVHVRYFEPYKLFFLELGDSKNIALDRGVHHFQNLFYDLTGEELTLKKESNESN